MDLGTIVIAAILVAICGMPFLLIGMNRNKRKKSMVRALRHVAALHHSTLSLYEICGDIALGLSESENTFIFLKKSGEQETSSCIRLSEVRHCTLSNTSKTVKSKSGDYNVIEQLALHLVYKQAQKPEEVLEFYNLNGNLQLDGELQLLEKWTKIIKEQLQKQAVKQDLAKAS
jgi:hypothetical protein